MFGASSAPSYRGHQGLDNGQLFQDLGALYLAQEQTGKSSTKSKQGSRTNNLLKDFDIAANWDSWTPLTGKISLICVATWGRFKHLEADCLHVEDLMTVGIQ